MSRGACRRLALGILVAVAVMAFTPTTCQAGGMKASSVDFPEVPRIDVREAYGKYKAGLAIIIHAGGERFERRHIMGAYDISEAAVRQGKIKLPPLPKQGVEIFTYCY